MTTAKARFGAWTLALGLMVSMAVWVAPARAEPREGAAQHDDVTVALAKGVMSWFGTSSRAATPSPNVRIDPQSGAEIYVPTGETIDEVIDVVATKLPASVASIERKAPIELGFGIWTLALSINAVAHVW